MIKKTLISVILLLAVVFTAHTQQHCFFTHYSTEDGLSQNTVMNILQDHKDNLWFATWDGLYKFDGYTFKNYKAHPGDSIGLSNNRLDNIKEDKYGCIWVQSYDHQIYRFNPKTELFQAIPYKNYLSQSLYVLPCGDVWVVTTQNELIHITIHPENGDMKASNLSSLHQNSSLERINLIWQDQQQNQWILSENGLYKLNTNAREAQLSSYFVSPHPKDNIPFYDALESGNSIYFTSKRGIIYEFHPNKDLFIRQELDTRSSLKIIRQLKDDKLLICTARDGFFSYDLSLIHISEPTRPY